MPNPSFLISQDTPDWRFEEIALQISHIAVSITPFTDKQIFAEIFIKEDRPRRLERIKEELEKSIHDFLCASTLACSWHIALKKNLEHRRANPSHPESDPKITYTYSFYAQTILNDAPKV